MARVAEFGSAVDAIEAGLPEARDRDVGVPDRAGDRLRRAGGGRGQPVRPRRGGALRAAAGRPGDRGGAGGPAGRAARASGTPPRSTRALAELRAAAEGTDNVLYPMREALRARATVGEVCDALREVWGLYRPVGPVLNSLRSISVATRSTRVNWLEQSGR